MIPGDPACYRGTDILINKHDLRDPDLAHAVEYKFALTRELELEVFPIEGNFDFKHLQAVHQHVFQDTYEWAGQVRELDFAKRNKETKLVSRFTPQGDIPKKIEEFNRFIAENNQLKGLPKPEFVKLFTEAHTRLNEIHPFREGNGRSTRIYLTQLAREAGHELRIDKIDKDKWNMASHKAMTQFDPKNPAKSHPGSPALMREVFNEATRPTIEHAFEHEPRSVAVKTYPGLQPYFERMDNIAEKARKVGPPDAAEKYISTAKTHVINKLKIDRIDRQRNEAIERLVEARPGVNSEKSSVYGPRDDYQMVAEATREVFEKKGYSPQDVNLSVQKVARQLEVTRTADHTRNQASRQNGLER